MKKVILIILFPFWFFLSKTWLGNIMMIPMALAPIPILIHLIFPDMLMSTGEEAKGIGIGVGILALMFSPFVGVIFMLISDSLENNYAQWTVFNQEGTE